MWCLQTRSALSLVALVMIGVRPALAAPIIIETQNRGVWASTTMYCCPGWPPGAFCHTIEKSSQMIARSVHDSVFRATAEARCMVDDRGFIQKSATAQQTSTLSSSSLKAIGYVLGDDFPSNGTTIFHIKFLVLTAVKFQLSGTVWVRGKPESAITARISLIGEATQFELRVECCGVERAIDEVGILAPGRYEFLAFVTTGPDAGEGLFSLELKFPTQTSVREATWSSVRNLYR